METIQAGEERYQDTEDRYVILGNGAAGFYAASEIRRRDRTGEIVLISEEPWPSYRRPMLTKAAAGGVREEQMALASPEWYEEQKIRQMLGRKVCRIDPIRRKVELSGEGQLSYEKLIYALGSECFLPPIPGIRLPEVIAIRRRSDADRLRARMKTAGRAVVIGGGILGQEAAWELHKAGIAVTILEAAPLLMGRQLDEEAAEWFRQIVKKQGIGIRTGAQAASIDGTEHVTGVTLSEGEQFPADLVVVSAGVRANIEPAREAGLKVRKGVVVNEQMETNLQDIYACGDCTEYEGRNDGIWPQAKEQGRTAGANAAGGSAVYVRKEPELNFQGMSTALFAAGDTGKDPARTYQTKEEKEPEQGIYRKYYFLEGRLCGAILLGDVSEKARIRKLLKERASEL